MEYPPGALPVFLPPAAFGSEHYNAAFKALMALCGAATIVLVALLLVRLRAGALRLWSAVLLLAQASRSLQVESLGGSLLGVADRVGWYSATVVHRTGHAISYDLAGSLPRGLAAASSVAQVVAVLAVVWLYVRGRDEPQRLVTSFAAAVAGFLAFTRFFSPQYLVWLIPLVALLGLAEWLLVGAALVLAQVWFFHYRDVFSLGGYIWLVLLRDALAVALFAVALFRLRRRPTEDEYSVPLEDKAPVGIPS